jgi:DNA-binding response OmpR family regulator
MGNLVDLSRVVLAQRDSIRRALNAQILSRAGFVVRQTDDGLAANATAVDWPAGVVVADIALPRVSGFELCRRLRDDRRTSETFIVGVTRWTGASDYERAMQAGFDLLISDQADPQTFLSEIQRLRSQGASLRRKAVAIQRRAAEAISDAAKALARSKMTLEARTQQLAITREDALKRIRSDYFELPGLKLTAVQGARLWGVGIEVCATLLNELTSKGFLRRVDDHYGRP